MVTHTQLKKHAEEAAKKQSIATMGRNLTAPATELRIKPITGDDIFPPHVSAPTTTPPADEGALCPNASAGPSPPITSPPPLVLPRFIEDNDFPPDDVGHLHDPSQVPEPPSYPSMEMSDTDEDSSETEDQGKTQNESNLNESMDEEYLKQGTLSSAWNLSHRD